MLANIHLLVLTYVKEKLEELLLMGQVNVVTLTQFKRDKSAQLRDTVQQVDLL